ncbi:MAG: hypothetical protein M1822_003164 [Bathelium mastoideum]|nr:MAG: hypothetical protein M1822_003164 [Bathelium mastoideum]
MMDPSTEETNTIPGLGSNNAQRDIFGSKSSGTGSNVLPRNLTPPSPHLSPLARLRAEQQAQADALEEERLWASLQRDNAELLALRERRARIEAGDAAAQYTYADPKLLGANQSHDGPNRSYLPKPEPPHVFKGRDRADFDHWVRDCESYFRKSRSDFPTEREKVDFAFQYVVYHKQTLWTLEVQGKRLVQVDYEPDWEALKDSMLNSMGTPTQRKDKAHLKIKSIHQRPRQSPLELMAVFRPLWAELKRKDEEEMAREYKAALEDSLRTKMDLRGDPKPLTIFNIESQANEL